MSHLPERSLRKEVLGWSGRLFAGQAPATMILAAPAGCEDGAVVNAALTALTASGHPHEVDLALCPVEVICLMPASSQLHVLQLASCN